MNRAGGAGRAGHGRPGERQPEAAPHVERARPDLTGRRERRKVRTRRALLDAALALIATHGVYDARVEDITDAADLGKGAFYNYFASKDDLVATLVGEAADELLEHCAQLVAPSDPVEARVAVVVRAHDAFFRTRPACQLLFHQARGLLMRQQPRDAALAEVFRRYLDALGAILAGADSGAPPAGARDLAAAVAGAITGYRSFEPATGVAGSAAAIERFVAAGVTGWAGLGRVRQGEAG